MKCFVRVGGREFVVQVKASAEGTAIAVVDGREIPLAVVTSSRPGRDRRAQEILAGGASRRVSIALAGPGAQHESGKLRLLVNNRLAEALVETERDRLRALSRPAAATGGRVTARSTLPGVIRRIFRKQGDEVEEGEAILTLEAMKMENEVRAEAKGRVLAVLVKEGQVVNAGDALAELEAE